MPDNTNDFHDDLMRRFDERQQGLKNALGNLTVAAHQVFAEPSEACSTFVNFLAINADLAFSELRKDPEYYGELVEDLGSSLLFLKKACDKAQSADRFLRAVEQEFRAAGLKPPASQMFRPVTKSKSNEPEV